MRCGAMPAIRLLLARHARLAALLLALALCVRALVPTGYMIEGQGGAITVALCDASSQTARAITIDVGAHKQAGDVAKDSPCAFSSLAHAATAGADAPLLALALAFILALGFAPSAFPALTRPARLRPPLRAPPQAAPAA